MMRRSDGIILFLFFIVAASYFALLKRSGLVLCGPEQFFVYHPLQMHWLAQLLEGNLPWLAANVGGGLPLWSDPNLGLFYPGNILYFFFSFHDAWNFSIVFHLLWGQIGIYWFCRKQNVTPVAALTGALAFLFSGTALAALNANELLITSSWTPWIVRLAYDGFIQSARKTAVASVALACQWLGGFTTVQLLTLFLLIAACFIGCRRHLTRTVLLRFVFLLASTIGLTAIQWLPAALWLPQTAGHWLEFGSVPALSMIHPGWVGTILCLPALRVKTVWPAALCAAADSLLFGVTPVFGFAVAFVIAFGAQSLLDRFRLHPAVSVIPFLLAAELVITNWHIPQSIPSAQLNNPPRMISEIPDTLRYSLYWSGTTGALSPVAGLRWGLKYGAPPDRVVSIWRTSRARSTQIESLIRERKRLELLRDARIGYVISDRRFDHRELIHVKQTATKFFVHRVARPLSAVVVSDNRKAGIRWSEPAPNVLLVQTNSIDPFKLTVHKNSLPGWKCEIDGNELPVFSDTAGWIQVEAPAGTHELSFTYRTPGALAGSFFTAIATILLLAFLIL